MNVLPESRRTARNWVVHTLAIVAIVAIFTVERLTPLESAIGMLYGGVVLLGLWSTSARYPLIVAVIATALVCLDLALKWRDPIAPMVLVNRVLMFGLFGSTALAVRHVKTLESRVAQHVGELADFKRALDAAAIVATTDVRGRITYVNDKFTEISGYSREELLGQDHRIVNSAFHPKEYIRELWTTIANGRVWHGEIRNRAKDGRIYWVDTTIIPFLDARGKPHRYIAIRADITERKRAEARLARQAALARVGQMAAVLAHEIRNPLAGIRGAMQVLVGRRAQDDPERAVMQEIIERTESLNGLINDLLLFARPRPPQLSSEDLLQLARDAVATIAHDPVAREVAISVTGESLKAPVDGDLIRATLVNLLLNAAQAMRGHGRIDIEVRTHQDSAEIEVRDTGPGIPVEIRDHVFDPFFTTKTHGGGLGLPIAQRTAELHGGSLVLTSPAEGGAVALLTLPLTAQPVAVAAPASPSSAVGRA